MFAALNKWPVLDQFNRPRIGSFMNEIDEILSGPRSEPVYVEPLPIPIPRTNLLACAFATHVTNQAALLKDLLRTGSSIHERDVNGDTSLHAIVLMSHPEQPWLVQSLSTLIQAGADPRLRNHAGYTVYDLACDGPPELGSLRRDLLLQALLEIGCPINDDRILAPRRLTQFYTSAHHGMICGGYSAQQATIFRQALRDRLKNYVDYHQLQAQSNIREAAIERVLSSDSSKWTAHPDSVFHEVLHYLQRVIQGKRRVVTMRRQRLPTQIWEGFQGNVDWPQMVDKALTTSILEFDWFKPVDPEDVFLSHVDNLIEQLEDLAANNENREYIDHLIQVLQNSIPSYRAVSLSKPDSDASNSSSRTTTPDANSNSPTSKRSLSLQTDAQQLSVLNESDIARKESIAKTPAEYYPPEIRARTNSMPVQQATPNESRRRSEPLTEGTKRQKRHWGTRRAKT